MWFVFLLTLKSFQVSRDQLSTYWEKERGLWLPHCWVIVCFPSTLHTYQSYYAHTHTHTHPKAEAHTHTRIQSYTQFKGGNDRLMQQESISSAFIKTCYVGSFSRLQLIWSIARFYFLIIFMSSLYWKFQMNGFLGFSVSLMY